MIINLLQEAEEELIKAASYYGNNNPAWVLNLSGKFTVPVISFRYHPKQSQKYGKIGRAHV
jgi:hypothetical protein